MLGMWHVWDIGCCGCGMLGIWNVWDVGCSGCGMLDVRVVGCSRCRMFGMWGVQDMECWGCGMLGLCDVRDLGCLTGCGMLIYKMPEGFSHTFNLLVVSKGILHV